MNLLYSTLYYKVPPALLYESHLIIRELRRIFDEQTGSERGGGEGKLTATATFQSYFIRPCIGCVDTMRMEGAPAAWLERIDFIKLLKQE